MPRLFRRIVLPLLCLLLTGCYSADDPAGQPAAPYGDDLNVIAPKGDTLQKGAQGDRVKGGAQGDKPIDSTR